ncbi:HhH-GPD superfamily base excision DNA repair protein [Coniella lustricola]|uniref:HhH-GPD superfamily base excision DNA repair protein n=1 Tax=Coniella lustricola TaxID=2025994 RepID=A0A2T3AHA1_9PEZI|nr:HhH-GPD superfamily base excision DNA repair protein [Coniella lustricola]
MTTRRSARLTAKAVASPAAGGAQSMLPPQVPPTKARKRKVASSPAEEDEPLPATPSTPKRRTNKLMAEPAAINGTETPSAPKTLGASATTTPKPKMRAVARLADPNATNATLLSPETSRIAAIQPSLESLTPSSHAQLTTATLLSDACAHLTTVEPRLKPLIDAHHCRVFSPEGLAEKIDPFEAIASGIISQQVSGAAAKAIKTRFVALFDPAGAADATTTTASRKFPTPSQVAVSSIETLRGAGLSQRKAEYIQGLAEKFHSGDLTAKLLADASYEEVLEKLIAVRGLGQWSVEMFACFGLKRMDVFSTGDLGVQRGMAAFAGRDVSKLKAKGGGNKWKYMSEKEMLEMAAPFSPYRSVFMWYMWRVEETDISTLE